MSRSDQTMQTLLQSRKLLAEMETVGEATVQELSRQNKQVTDNRGGIVEIQTNLNHSNKLLNKMKRVWQQLFR